MKPPSYRHMNIEIQYRLDETVKYYDTNADSFADATIYADVSEPYKKFERLILPGSWILDIGCRSRWQTIEFI